MDLRISRLTVSLITMLVLTDNTSAQNNFTVTVQFFRYSNPTSKIGSQMNKPCCGDCSDDNCTTCTEDCNNYFIFCLRPPNQSSANPNDKLCPFGRLQTGVVLGGDNIIFVSSTQHSNAFNIPNPFTFDNLQQIDTIQLLVMTLDNSEGDNDSLVEQFSIDILMRRGNSLRETFEGEFDVATIRLSYDLSCAENYYGELCDVFCEGRNDSSGHYSCDDDGNVVCLSGFTDPSTLCVCAATSSEECLQDFGQSVSASVVAGAIIGTLIGMVLIVTIVMILMCSCSRRKTGGSQKWNVFSHMCHESETKKSSYTSRPNNSEECNTHENPTYEDEAFSTQGTITTRASVANSPHSYDYIIGSQHGAQQHVKHPDVSGTSSSNNGPYSYAETRSSGTTAESSPVTVTPVPYSYAVNTMPTEGKAKTTPYSYVDNTLIQDMVLKAVHEADAERLRTLQSMKEEDNVDTIQHYETMQNFTL